jgi:subtilisin family serine protease
MNTKNYAGVCIKYLLGMSLSITFALSASAQKANWQNLDLKKDSVFGISTEMAYTDLLKGKKAKTVLVAVIDGGIDTAHEDLKGILWKNRGWNFIGSAKGDVHYDNLELTRLVRNRQADFAGKDSSAVKPQDLQAFYAWRAEASEWNKQMTNAQNIVNNINGFKQVLTAIRKIIGKDNPTLADFQNYTPRSDQEAKVTSIITVQLKNSPDLKAFIKQVDAESDHFKEETDYHLNLKFDPRDTVGDDYANDRQSNYGNRDIMGPDAHHGTHVAGIIGAIRDNNMGIKGIADHVSIMGVRVVPNGDERDKDVANGIRYAVDHGAKVINMSFGKGYSFDKKVVDSAVKYAMSKDVLIIHAAGNSNLNLDSVANFPNRHYGDGSGQADAWIEVGASGWKNDTTLKASFSNYGKHTVDVFAPGEQINSAIPGNQYALYDGTSMAAPVVAGLAALIREYYPKLTALQVKDIILRSVAKVDHNVMLANGQTQRSVPFTDLCLTGGIVNAYDALELASKYTKQK